MIWIMVLIDLQKAGCQGCCIDNKSSHGTYGTRGYEDSAIPPHQISGFIRWGGRRIRCKSWEKGHKREWNRCLTSKKMQWYRDEDKMSLVEIDAQHFRVYLPHREFGLFMIELSFDSDSVLK